MNIENNKINCHSQVSLLGISTTFSPLTGEGSKNVGHVLPDSCFPRPLRERVAVGRERGFTLLELIITVIIIAVLAAFAVSAYQKAVLKSRFSAVIPPTKTIANAQELYYMNEGSYATNIRNLDIKLNDDDSTVTLSDKKNYKYVMGTPNGSENNHYIVYQKHSKRFANDIHCEAQKDDTLANWLCETALGGTLITGSINRSNWLTYLLLGEGKGKFLREDCPAGYYDNNGQCSKAQAGYYAEDGERKMCEAGTYQPNTGATSCEPCPVGKFNDGRWPTGCWSCNKGSYADEEGLVTCKLCPLGTYSSSTGATSCDPCPVGQAAWHSGMPCSYCVAGFYADTEGSAECKPCPNGMYQPEKGATSCIPCPPGTAGRISDKRGCNTCSNGYYAANEGSSSCTKCPSGQTSNDDHTGCI